MSNKQKIIYVTPLLVLDMLKSPPGARPVEPLPTDLVLRHAFVSNDYTGQRIGLVVESDSFPECEDGALIPELRPLYEKVDV
jgi:hypothetical protein